MIGIDIAAASFILMSAGVILKLMNEMKTDIKQSVRVEAEILKQLELLSYRVLQLETKM